MKTNEKIIGIAADHAGYELKEIIKPELEKMGYTYKDFGTNSTESMDYPDVAHPLAKAVATGELPKGIAICGSGNGISMVANKHNNVRAAICWNEEIAALARQHNDANICSLPARFISAGLAISIVKIFLSTEFEGGRHLRRVNKINCQ
jgi:ribose 5-phosphate isomerase B